MASFLKHRRHRFDALHALLTGLASPSRKGVPSSLRRDVGLPETLDTRAPHLLDPALDPALGAPRCRNR